MLSFCKRFNMMELVVSFAHQFSEHKNILKKTSKTVSSHINSLNHQVEDISVPDITSWSDGNTTPCVVFPKVGSTSQCKLFCLCDHSSKPKFQCERAIEQLLYRALTRSLVSHINEFGNQKAYIAVVISLAHCSSRQVSVRITKQLVGTSLSDDSPGLHLWQ